MKKKGSNQEISKEGSKMVNGPLDFLFQRPNSDRSSGGPGIFLNGWRLSDFGRRQNERESDGTGFHGFRMTVVPHDENIGDYRQASTISTTTTTTTTTEKPWRWDSGTWNSWNHAIVRFVREHKNEMVLGVGILLFLLGTIHI